MADWRMYGARRLELILLDDLRRLGSAQRGNHGNVGLEIRIGDHILLKEMAAKGRLSDVYSTAARKPKQKFWLNGL
jgi:hypothetical protein